jgi:hypothetical protein
VVIDAFSLLSAQFTVEVQHRRHLVRGLSLDVPNDNHLPQRRRHLGHGALTMVGPARFQYDLDEDGRIKTNPDGSISNAWWAQDDNHDWQPWMNNTFRRVVGKA